MMRSYVAGGGDSCLLWSVAAKQQILLQRAFFDYTRENKFNKSFAK
jgi:hypothetical protein